MNTFDVMTRPNDAAAVLDAYATAVSSDSVEADLPDVPVDAVDELAVVDAAVAEPEAEPETLAAEAPLLEEPATAETATGSMARLLRRSVKPRRQ